MICCHATKLCFYFKFAKAEIADILGGFFLIISTLTIYNFNNNSKISKLIPVYENILKQDNISDASLNMNFTPLIDSTGTKHFIYTVTIKTTKNFEQKNNLDDYINNPELKQTVETFINSKVYESENDILNINVNSGFDIGIASLNSNFNVYKPIYEWKRVYLK